MRKSDKNNWAEKFIPNNMVKSENFSADNIILSVHGKLENEKGRITMTKTRKIKPLIIAAAIASTAAISMISVNAMTDGAVTDAIDSTIHKVKVFINGEETDAELVDSGVDENGVEYQVYELYVDDDEVKDDNEVRMEMNDFVGEDSRNDEDDFGNTGVYYTEEVSEAE